MNKRIVRRYLNKLNKIEENIFNLQSQKKVIINIMNTKGYDVIGKSYGLPYPVYSAYRQENDEILNEFWGE